MNKLILDDAIRNDLSAKGLEIQHADSSFVSLVKSDFTVFSDKDIKHSSEILGGFIISLNNMCRTADFSIVDQKSCFSVSNQVPETFDQSGFEALKFTEAWSVTDYGDFDPTIKK